MTDNLPARVDAQIALAKTMAHSNLLPRQYQQNPANLMWAIQYAEALGVHPMTAVTGIHVIEGKPTASAQLIGGLVRRGGHKLRVTFDKATQTATAQIIRQDDPDFTFESAWSMDRAKAAGLTGKKVWQQYPDAMLKARAITEVARDACPEALFGVIYTAEELGADGVVTDDGGFEPTPPARIEVVTQPEPAPRLLDAEHTEEPTPGQIQKIHALKNELGLTDVAYRSALQKAAGVTSSKQLTKSSAQRIIDMMVTAVTDRDTADDDVPWDAEIVEEAA